jgi:hypothetical protein
MISAGYAPGGNGAGATALEMSSENDRIDGPELEPLIVLALLAW